MNIADHIRTVPDFPKPGILFYDISTLLAHPQAWRSTINQLSAAIHPLEPTMLVGIESRGFLVAAPLALELGIGFAMIRKAGRLPGAVDRLEYDLEYGTDTIEVQHDMVEPGQRIVVVDDLLATGGTIAATARLLRGKGAEVVGSACIIELTFLNGRERLDMPFTSLIQYDE